MSSERFLIHDLAGLREYAQHFVRRHLREGLFVALHGDLGAGKTALVREILLALGVRQAVTSPTFILRKEYLLPAAVAGVQKIVHVDAYRIEGGSAEDLGALLEPGAAAFVEWSEKIPHLIPKDALHVHISTLPDESREVLESF